MKLVILNLFPKSRVMHVLTAHQISLFPWPGLIHKFLLCDEFIIMDKSQFRARSFMHRSHIEINKSPFWITWPIYNPTKLQSISELSFSNPDLFNAWIKKTYTQIRHRYSKCQHWSDTATYLDDLLQFCGSAHFDNTPLSVFIHFLAYLKKRFQLSTKITLESELNNLCTESPTLHLISHINCTDPDIYLLGNNARSYFDFSLCPTIKTSLYIQSFNYDRFLSFQSTPKILSFLHSLSYLGWDQFIRVLFDDNVSKSFLIRSMSMNNYGVGNSFYESHDMFASCL